MQMPPNLKIGGTSVTPLPVTAPSSEFATSLGSVGHRCRSRLCIDRTGPRIHPPKTPPQSFYVVNITQFSGKCSQFD